MSWDRRFAAPILLPDGGELVTRLPSIAHVDMSALTSGADMVSSPRMSAKCQQQTSFNATRARFSQSHGRPVVMTAVPLQPFSRSPAGSGGRAAVGGEVGS